MNTPEADLAQAAALAEGDNTERWRELLELGEALSITGTWSGNADVEASIYNVNILFMTQTDKTRFTNAFKALIDRTFRESLAALKSPGEPTKEGK